MLHDSETQQSPDSHIHAEEVENVACDSLEGGAGISTTVHKGCSCRVALVLLYRSLLTF